MLRLPDVTLIGVEHGDNDRLMMAVNVCRHYCEFGAVKILTWLPCDDEAAVSIPPIAPGSHGEFCITELHKYIDTKYALVIRHDGFILNPDAWTDEFMEYDYVGAPWDFNDDMNVGDGGFSLRSKRFMEAAARYVQGPPWEPEDVVCCRMFGKQLREKGLRFAPEHLAERFSKEGNAKHGHQWDGQFGFHEFYQTDLGKWDAPLPVREWVRPVRLLKDCWDIKAQYGALARQFQRLRRQQRRSQQQVAGLQQFLRGMVLESAAKEAGYTDGTEEMSPNDVEDLAVSLFSEHRQAGCLGVSFHSGDGEKERGKTQVDCERRLSTCHAACCSLTAPLTREETKNPIYHIDVAQPFALRRDAKTGYCSHLSEGKCIIYDGRPAVCWQYSCVKDGRVWQDFERMTPGSRVRRLERRLDESALRESMAATSGEPAEQ